MALSLGLEASGALKMTQSLLNVRISLILALIFHISDVSGPIGLCFGFDAPMGLCYNVSKAHGPITKFRGP